MKNLVWGLIFVAFGLLLLLDNMGVADFGDMLSQYWPVLIILWGISILTRRSRHTPSPTTAGVETTNAANTMTDTDLIHHSSVFGDLSVKVTSKNFKGGSVSTIFGDCQLDLTSISPAEGDHLLHVHSVFGDSVITIPRNAAIAVSGQTTFGDLKIFDQTKEGFSSTMESATPEYVSSTNRLKLSVSKVFGDIRVFVV